MNEKRIQAYLTLIQSLLTCADGEEANLLAENWELVDEGLVQVMGAVAQQYGEAGRENEARWLLTIAQQLAAALGLSEGETTATANTPEDYLNFLMDTLQKVSENPNPQLLYPFWAQNIDKLDENLARILDSWARDKLTQVTTEQAHSIAADILNFSTLIQQFPLGNVATNKEIAITGYKITLNIFTFEAFPYEWATTQNNLAITYFYRIRGERAENLELAIAAYTEALKVYTFEAFPQKWAMAQNNLAIAYFYRIRGEKAENLELAIAACTEALKVYTFEAFPFEWARTQNNLAIAYQNRIRGEKAENLELAIAACTEALKIYTFEAFPYEWAMAQNNLANAYRDRIRGEKAENLERAIAAYGEALKVFLPQTLPNDCRRTARLLGNLYAGENLWQEAIQPYKLALEAVEVLYEASLSLAGKEEELAATGNLFHHTAYVLTRVGHLESAVLTLEQGRARSLSETLARDRADLEQVKNLAPEVYESYQKAASLLRNLHDLEG